MHRIGVALPFQVAVDLLRDERRERRGDLGELHQDVAERAVGGKLVRVVRRLPEPAAAAADVPVRQILHELHERTHRALQVVGVHRRGHVGDERFHGRDDPAIQHVRAFGIDHLGVGEAVHVRVGHEERVGVPPRNQQVAQDLLDAVLGELEVLGAHDGRVDHVEADGVRPVGVEHQVGVWIVLEPLGHLLAVLGQHEPVDDHVPVGRLSEQHRAQEHERVEPAARLVETLGDEVRREEVPEAFRVRLAVRAAHVVLLGVGHGARLEPAVQHFGGAMVGLAVLLDDDLVHVVLVEVGRLHAGERLQFGDGPHADHVRRVGVVDPHGDAAAPEAVARDVPVARILQPVAEALFAHVRGRPVHRFVVGDELVVQVLDLHVPGVDGAVDERRIRAVAVGIGVHDRGLVDELAFRLEALDDVLVAILAEASLVFGDFRTERRARVQRVDDGVHAGFLADAEVVLAVGGGDVHEARAVVRRDVVVVQHAEGAFGLLRGVVGEDGLVFPALERRTLHFGDDFILLRLFEVDGQARLGHDVDGPGRVRQIPHRHVVDRRAGADHEVLGERPGGRRPDEEVDGRARGELQASRGKRLHAHGDRRVLHVLVVRARLEVRQRRGKLPRIGHDAVRLVDAPLVPELLEDPPDGLHEVGVHGLVVVVEIDPPPHARHGLAPFGDVLEHHRAALFVELVHAEFLDLGRAGDPQRILGQRLDRQAVRIPPEPALDVLAAHGLVARHDILDRAGQKVAVVRQARRERRPVVEFVAFLALVLLEGLPERAVFRPESEDVLFHLREGDFVGYRLEHTLFSYRLI